MIRETIGNYGRFLSEQNTSEILSLYSNEAEIIPDGLPSITTIKNIKKFYETTFSSIKIAGDLIITSVDVDTSNELAIVRCEEKASVTDLATDNVLKSYFRELFVLKKEKDIWKIYKYMFSQNISQAE